MMETLAFGQTQGIEAKPLSGVGRLKLWWGGRVLRGVGITQVTLRKVCEGIFRVSYPGYPLTHNMSELTDLPKGPSGLHNQTS